MTVVIVADFGYVEGGAAKVALDSACMLSKAGYDVIFFCGSTKVDPQLKSFPIRIVKLDQYQLKENPSKLNAMASGLWNLKAAHALRNLLAELDPETAIIHVHSWTKILSPSIFAVLRKSGFRTVMTCHDYFLVCPNGAFYDYVHKCLCHNRGGGLACLLCNCDARNYAQKIWRWIRQRIVTFQLNRFPHLLLLTISNQSQRILSTWLPRCIHCRRLNNPLPETKKETCGSHGDVFFFIGRVSPEKGPELFAKAIMACGVKGVVVGDGPCLEHLRMNYPSLEYTGWLAQDEIKDLVRKKAAAYVFPSVLYEGAPLTPLEMMAENIPCIISDCTAATEYVEDGVTGLLFRMGDVEDLAAQIRKMSDSSYRSLLTSNLKKMFDLDKWSVSAHLERLAEIYGHRGK